MLIPLESPLPQLWKIITNLQRREEVAFSISRDRSAIEGSPCPEDVEGEAPDHCPNADSWADLIIREADEKGYDNVFQTWEAVRRIKALKRGERAYTLSH